MALLWTCDRCGCATSNGGVDDPPEGWVAFSLDPQREDLILCNICRISLARWFGTTDEAVQ